MAAITSATASAAAGITIERPNHDGALVPPETNTEAMQLFLDALSKSLSADKIAVMCLDQAGWHGARRLVAPEEVVLRTIPADTPELDPMERVCQFLEERFLPRRPPDDYDSIADATCAA